MLLNDGRLHAHMHVCIQRVPVLVSYWSEKSKVQKRDKFNANMKWQNIDLNGFVQDIVAYCYTSGVFIDGRLSV